MTTLQRRPKDAADVPITYAHLTSLPDQPVPFDEGERAILIRLMQRGNAASRRLPDSLRGQPHVFLLIMLASIVGLAFIVVVTPGLPYDEPSHWANVLYYAHHARIPRIGDPAVTYEAQMGPLAYAVDALVAAPLRLLGNGVAFYAVRVVGLLELFALSFLISRQARRAMPQLPAAPLVAGSLVLLNPMLLAMSSSIQNDTLALLLAALSIELVCSKRAAAAGAVAGVALLTKITVWPVVIVAAVWLLRRQLRAAMTFTLVALAVSGWWFLRNVQLYGDLTGRRAVKEAGYDFPPLAHADPVAITRSVSTYLWLPTEYVRNLVQAPSAVDGLVVALSLVGLVAVAMLVKDVGQLRPPTTALIWTALLATGGWLITIVASQAVAFRFAYVALPAWFLGFSNLIGRRRKPGLWLSVAVLVCLGISAWFLVQASQVPQTLGYRIRL